MALVLHPNPHTYPTNTDGHPIFQHGEWLVLVTVHEHIHFNTLDAILVVPAVRPLPPLPQQPSVPSICICVVVAAPVVTKIDYEHEYSHLY